MSLFEGQHCHNPQIAGLDFVLGRLPFDKTALNRLKPNPQTLQLQRALFRAFDSELSVFRFKVWRFLLILFSYHCGSNHITTVRTAKSYSCHSQ